MSSMPSSKKSCTCAHLLRFNYEFPSSKVAGQKDKFTHSSCVVIFPTLVSFLYGIAKGKFDGDAMDRVPAK